MLFMPNCRSCCEAPAAKKHPDLANLLRRTDICWGSGRLHTLTAVLLAEETPNLPWP